METNARAIFLGYLLYVLPVVAAHHYVGDAGTLGSEYLLLYAAHGQHLAAQRYLACHGGVLAHLALRKGRGYRRGDGDSGRRAVLGRGAFGHVDVYVPVVEHAVVHSQHINVCLDVLQCYHGRLLHHIAEVARQRQLAGLALAQRGLDEEYLAADTCPCQTCHHSRVVVALIYVAVERRLAEQVIELCWRYLGVG